MSPYDSPLQPQPGSSLDPKNAVGRSSVTARARRELLAGNNLALTDPRRMGKTVWLSKFASDPGEGLAVVQIDYEGVTTTEAFLLQTMKALRGHASLRQRTLDRLRGSFDGFEATVGSLSVKPGVAARPPLEMLSDLLGSVDDELDQGQLLVVLMDEVPIAIKNVIEHEGKSAANALLQSLRELRRRPATKLRWIVCGSIGFHHVLRLCDATEGAINDLVNLPLGPLEPEEAEELAARLLLGIERHGDELATAALAEQAGAIPFLIHSLAQRLRDAGTGPATADDIRSAFLDFMDDRDGSRAVTHLLTRLDPLYGASTGAAEAILDRLAITETVAIKDLSDPQELIDDLLDDHYLVEHRGTLSWRYDVLRRIWIHRRRLA